MNAAGGVARHDNLSGIADGYSVTRPDYTIRRNDGGWIVPGFYDTLSGQVVDISPSGGTGSASLGSGVTLQFGSGINAIGFEVGDWGTCCRPSALYVSFDDGDPIQVGISQVEGDVYFDGKSEVFVGAFDDTNKFSKVQFWGDGDGEYLVFGGTVSYALLDKGTLAPQDVPEPATFGLLAAGALGAFAARRRKPG